MRDPGFDAERLKELRESLDTVWQSFETARLDPKGFDAVDAGRQELLSLLNEIARGAQLSEMWSMIGDWAGKRA